jgi:hypothetical protein
MVVGFLFSYGCRNTISWMILLILCLEWDVIATFNRGPLCSVGCTARYATAAGGSVTLPTSVVVRTSYRCGCGSVSGSVDCTGVYLRYALTFLFSLCIICTKCILLITLNFIFRNGHLTMQSPGPHWPTVGRTSLTSHAP